jgi:alkanesulfonate monooxygenase SsuD/methylene tetrahydromethanopterin reductase-like flavin-dependent oxidoreductase (luciferase family)
VRRDPSHADAATIERSGWAVFGSPRDVATKLREFAATGVDEVLGIFDFGGLPGDEVRASVTALGREFGASRPTPEPA